MWSLSTRYEKFWGHLQPQDNILFYATTPVKGVIGSGVVKKVKKSQSRFWPEEIKEGKILWPLIIEFDNIKCIPKEKWENTHIALDHQGITFQRTLQQITDERGRSLLQALQKAIVKQMK